MVLIRHLSAVTEPDTTPQRPAPVPLQIITGFLGAGKTTLLNRLLKAPELSGSIVIVNEFGEVGLDHLMIEGADDGMILMASGCLCCTIRGDLVNTLEDLLRRRDNGRIAAFNRVIIETTGIADPAPILNVVLMHPYLSQRYEVDGVVTVVDAVNGLATITTHDEALRQVAVADRIVVSKTDLTTGTGIPTDLGTELGRLNPGARQLDAARGDADVESLIGLGLFDLARKPVEVEAWLAIDSVIDSHHLHTHDTSRHGADIRAFSLISDKPVRSQTLDLFWSLLRTTHGPKLLRLKGIVCLAERPDQPIILHAAQQVMHPPVTLAAWPSDDRRSRLVLIVKGLDPLIVDKLWTAFLGQS
ncbi:MAG: CobW family GTP-binding protein [Bosea sp. (in: a-proteobacteria)]